MPDEIAFQTKPQVVLDQIRPAIADGVTQGIVLVDAGYGNHTAFRSRLVGAEERVYACRGIGINGSMAQTRDSIAALGIPLITAANIGPTARA